MPVFYGEAVLGQHVYFCTLRINASKMSSFSNNVFEKKYSSFFGTFYISFQIVIIFFYLLQCQSAILIFKQIFNYFLLTRHLVVFKFLVCLILPLNPLNSKTDTAIFFEQSHHTEKIPDYVL